MNHFEVPEYNRDEYRKEVLKNNRRYTITRYELPDAVPINGNVDPIVIEHYQRHKKGKRTLIVHPILGGKNIIAKLYAYFFMLFHWNVIIIHRARYPMESDTAIGFELGVQNIIYNNLQAYDWLMYHKLIDPDYTISLGTSLGALTNSALSGILPIRGFICNVGGGNIIDVVKTSKQKRIRNWRKRIMKINNWTVEEFYEKYLREMETDNLQFARRANSKDVLLFGALFDKAVPTKTQFNLARAYKKKWYSLYPLRFWFPTGHVLFILMFPITMPISLVWAWWKTRR